MISDIKRKSLPEIGKFVGLHNEQSLLHFVSESPWQVEDLREQRLKLILQVLQGREINLIIDETGDRKKGSKTDYVKRQYIGNLGKVENGIVAVTAYGLIEGMTFPLIFEVYKPKERLERGDAYRTKPEIAAILIQKLQAMGFKFKLVLDDSLYGESDKRREMQYWQITDDPKTLPKNSTWYVLTKVPGVKYKEVGNLYGLRNWVEYGLKT